MKYVKDLQSKNEIGSPFSKHEMERSPENIFSTSGKLFSFDLCACFSQGHHFFLTHTTFMLCLKALMLNLVPNFKKQMSETQTFFLVSEQMERVAPLALLLGPSVLVLNKMSL